MVLGQLNFERMFVMKLEQLKELSKQIDEVNGLRKEAMVILENLLKNESSETKDYFYGLYWYNDYRFYFMGIADNFVYYERNYSNSVGEYDSISLDISGLATDTREKFWKKYVSDVKQMLADKKAKKLIDDEKAQKAKEKKEREEYERLKKKFEKELYTA